MLKQQIQQAVNEAMKSKEELLAGTLRMVLASIISKEKEKRYKISKSESKLAEKELEEKSALAEEEIIDLLFSEIKKRRDAVALYEKGNRPELADKEKKEIEIIKKYLPEQIPADELRKIVEESIAKTGAKEIKDTGKIMQDLMPKIKGRADNSEISKIIKEILSK